MDATTRRAEPRAGRRSALVGDRVVPGWVEVAGGRITRSAERRGDARRPIRGARLHRHPDLHGAGGASALDAGADSSVLDAMAAVLVRHG